ncbi:MAG: M48 family metallopeptidase [Alphaproteobacteria bacterium]|nr:M48 family metallopeptidase [Alphaproteobacteria bacterium]MCD8520037.1 M48 family metallopeptidase [Alphaproteobacteria bacterium]MCD8569971.1 M48 family metallopeptidase [Alphaproteobacteria bacterium]
MALASSGLKTHIWNNNLKSLALLAGYPFLIMGIVWACGFVMGMAGDNVDLAYAAANAHGLIAGFWPLIVTGILIWFVIAWFSHTKMVRNLAHSHPVTRKEELELYNLLENLCISQGMVTPRLEIIETHARNAFASGVNDKTYTVTVTRGLMNSLAKDELEGVLAHELTHIINRDVRLLIVTIIFTGMVGFAAQMVWSSLRHGFVYSRNDRKKGGGALIMLGILIVLWIGYLATLLMRFALSRSREYMADAGAIEMTKNPDAMMRALLRIAGKDKIPAAPADIGLMCIENRTPFLGLFATHPPIESRIKALSNLTGAPVPDTNSLPPVPADERGIPSSTPNPWLMAKRHNQKC